MEKWITYGPDGIDFHATREEAEAYILEQVQSESGEEFHEDTDGNCFVAEIVARTKIRTTDTKDAAEARGDGWCWEFDEVGEAFLEEVL